MIVFFHKRDWTKWLKGIALGALATVAILLVTSVVQGRLGLKCRICSARKRRLTRATIVFPRVDENSVEDARITRRFLVDREYILCLRGLHGYYDFLEEKQTIAIPKLLR